MSVPEKYDKSIIVAKISQLTFKIKGLAIQFELTQAAKERLKNDAIGRKFTDEERVLYNTFKEKNKKIADELRESKKSLRQLNYDLAGRQGKIKRLLKFLNEDGE